MFTEPFLEQHRIARELAALLLLLIGGRLGSKTNAVKAALTAADVSLLVSRFVVRKLNMMGSISPRGSFCLQCSLSQPLARLSLYILETRVLRGDLYSALLTMVAWLFPVVSCGVQLMVPTFFTFVALPSRPQEETLPEDIQEMLSHVMVLVWEALLVDCDVVMVDTAEPVTNTDGSAGTAAPATKEVCESGKERSYGGAVCLFPFSRPGADF